MQQKGILKVLSPSLHVQSHGLTADGEYEDKLNFVMLKVSRLSFFLFFVQDLINQGRQKVIEATNALKTLSRETLEDTIARVVSVQRLSS